MKRTIAILSMTLLAASLAFAGNNASTRPFVKMSGDVEGLSKSGPYVEIRIGATGFSAVNAVHVDLEYDPSGLEFDSFEPGDLFSGPLVLGPFVREDRSVVDVTTASLSGGVSRESGEVGLLRFRVLDPERSEVRIVSFQTADDDWVVDTQVTYENSVGMTAVPGLTRLVGNVPNPFNPTTTISFDLSERAPVRLEVFSVSGRLVRTLASGVQDAGTHDVVWDGRGDDGTSASSGVYFYRLQSGKTTESKRMTLIR